jgi:hypothetical protein
MLATAVRARLKSSSAQARISLRLVRLFSIMAPFLWQGIGDYH